MPINRNHAFALGKTYKFVNNRPLIGNILDVVIRILFKISNYFIHQSIRSNINKYCVVGNNFRYGINAWCTAKNKAIIIGNGVILRGIIRCESYKDNTVEIGDNVYIGDDCIISCAENVRIGKNSLLAHGVQIFDNDTHPISYQKRILDWEIIQGKFKKERSSINTSHVIIGENCWIGMNSIVMKGVIIGNRSIIAAGSIVLDDIPEDVLAGGIPAKILRKL